MATSILGVGGSPSSQQSGTVETPRASTRGVQGASQTASNTVSSLQASDTTDLSDLGSFIATAAKQAGAQSSIRPDVVASLKAQLAAGTYHPDLDEVAARVAAAIKP